MRKTVALVAAAALAAALSGCAERAQNLSAKPGANYSGKPDTAPWQAQPTAYSAGNFNAGDKAGWEKAIKVRNAGQNEYARVR
jgi:hypothetical protein